VPAHVHLVQPHDVGVVPQLAQQLHLPATPIPQGMRQHHHMTSSYTRPHRTRKEQPEVQQPPHHTTLDADTTPRNNNSHGRRSRSDAASVASTVPTMHRDGAGGAATDSSASTDRHTSTRPWTSPVRLCRPPPARSSASPRSTVATRRRAAHTCGRRRSLPRPPARRPAHTQRDDGVTTLVTPRAGQHRHLVVVLEPTQRQLAAIPANTAGQQVHVTPAQRRQATSALS
jgi:hypothetical protein